MKIIFLFLFFGFSLEEVLRLPKYGSKYCYYGDYLYLDLSDFSEGDNIYLEVYFYSDKYYDEPFLYYRETADISQSYLDDLSFNNINNYDYSYSTGNYYGYYYYHENYYKVKLQTNNPYLVLKINFNRYDIKIKHSKTSHTAAIIIAICVIIVIALIAIGIYFYIRRRLSRARESIISKPLAATTATPEPIYSPPPGFDPFYNQPYYSTY